MGSRPPRVEVIDGHMTHTRVRRERGKPYEETIYNWNDQPVGSRTKHHPGREFVEVIVWQGEKATGDPVAEWELPVQLRYDLDLAARQAVAQTRFPAVENEGTS